ncbi:GMC oxidoreductase [Atractiella rhizophila]|nr:GMC oxidoreductase [Atractiella rhizophila]
MPAGRRTQNGCVYKERGGLCTRQSMIKKVSMNHLLLLPLFVTLPHSFARLIDGDASSLASSYDYVICGGGLAGLVLGSRLSEDADRSVLVIEAGGNGDDVRERIDHPGMAYYDGVTGTQYDWGFQTVNQTNLNGNQRYWPVGKILGGSSAINGAYLVKPSKTEIDAWHDLLDGTDGQDNWSWDTFSDAMKKAETFVPPSAEAKSNYNIEYSASSRGSSGPIHYSYPAYFPDAVSTWIPTLQALSLPIASDSSSGNTAGGVITTSAVNPTNWTRSYSRSGYLDPLPPRSNLDVLYGMQVTRLILDEKNGNVTQVEFAKAAGEATHTVNVNLEAVLSAGTMGSPRILMHSGIGPADVLSAAGIETKIDLPGVGEHLQDHLSYSLSFSTTSVTAGDLRAENKSDPEFLSYTNDAIIYVPGRTLFGDSYNSFSNELKANLSWSSQNVAPEHVSSNADVMAGYEAIYNTNAQVLLPGDVGQVEILLSLTGGNIAVQFALQHPLSQGRLYVTSSDPFKYPTIDPAYWSHPADKEILRAGARLARKIGQTAPLAGLIEAETSPGANVDEDSEWDEYIGGGAGTEYHPSSTCAMMAKNLGGVVDGNFKVYGVANLRVIDASVYPISFSCHLSAPTYGLGELGAQLIKKEHTSQSNGQTGNGGNNSSNSDNAAGGHSAASSNTVSMATAVIILIVSLATY